MSNSPADNQRSPFEAGREPAGPRLSVRAVAATAAAADRLPSAWSDAFDDTASLLSPMASAAYGRSVSFPKASLAAVQLGIEAEEAEAGSNATTWWWLGPARKEARNICRLALPLSVTNLAGFCIGLVTLSFTGRLGQFELSCAILATSIFNVSGLSLLMGFSAAMETFCGQAFGAGNYRLVGVVFQRAIILTTLVSIAVALLWTQAESLLLVFRQDPLLSRSAARYIQLTIPALWCTGMFEAAKRYLMAQGVVRPASVVTLVALALAPLYSWFFVFHLDWRLDGAAYAVDAIQLTMAVMLGGYILLRDVSMRGLPRATWHGWSTDALHGWLTYLRFALPSVAMICAEWWTFECVIIMAGWLPSPDLSVAVMGICIQTSGIVFMFITGFSMAASTRVSNSLGAGCPHIARRATWTAVGIAVSVEAAAMCGIMLLRHHWGRLFTDAPLVVELTASLLPIFALSLPGDGINATLQGLLRGAGRQETGAITNLCSYWVLGIPLAAFLAFKRNLGIHGLWWGLVVVNTWQGTIMLLIALRLNFEREAEKAVARSLAHHSTATGTGAAASASEDGSLHQPLLQGPQCERLEQGLLAPVVLSADAAAPEEAAALAAAAADELVYRAAAPAAGEGGKPGSAGSAPG